MKQRQRDRHAGTQTDRRRQTHTNRQTETERQTDREAVEGWWCIGEGGGEANQNNNSAG